jgi:outer membrane protein assembly factor BamB/tetratricopeptide (TPR) repeat protein
MGDTRGLRRTRHPAALSVRAWFAAGAAFAAAAAVSAWSAEMRINGPAVIVVGQGGRAIHTVLKRADQNSSFTGPPPLMHVDDEMAGYLRTAAEEVKAGKYDQAIQILQALIQRPESGFYAEESNRYVSMRIKATEMVGAMGEKGLKLYRTLYDPQAKRLYDEALASDCPDLNLRRLGERYLHTTWGPKAVEALAEIYFDRARFAQAAGCWRQLLSGVPAGPGRGAILAKIAAALSLAGQAEEARLVAEQVRKDYSNVSVEMGGASQSLAAFLDRVAKLGPLASEEGPGGSGGWPGLGGQADGLGRMSECDVVLAPQVQWPSQKQEDLAGDDLTGRLRAGGAMYLSGPAMRVSEGFGRSSSFGGSAARQTIRLREGHLQMRMSINNGSSGSSGSSGSDIVLPPMLHPVVAGGRVLVRADERVVSLDMLTLGDAWESVSLPMVRKLDKLPNMGIYFGGGYQYIGDSGRYAMTIGGGKVFTVYDFLPNNNSLRYIRQRAGAVADLDEGSRMAALSVKGQCMVLWSIGRGSGDNDVLRAGLFLTAPTYCAGRLYAVVHYLESYVAVCLDAETGKLIWRCPIAQVPAMATGMAYQLGADARLAVGSPPAVADGRVYVVTNAGAMAAMDAETGEPIWGYQYESRINVSSGSSMRSGYYPGRTAVWMPGNPVIVSRGLVVCLPADSDSVLALDGETGQPKWSNNRRNQCDLTAIDADRVLLSGQGLLVYRISDGAQLNAASPGAAVAGGNDLGDMNVFGRPAVSKRRVLASSLGKIYSMDLKTYAIATMELGKASGMLGNLVSTDGKLMAGSMLGVCAYFGYDLAHAELTRRIEQSTPELRVPLVLQRAQLAFDAKRFSQALEDLLGCRKLADNQHDDQTASQLPHLFYRTYVAMGNHAANDDEMKTMFEKAEAVASTVQEKAHMRLRMAKYFERAGRADQAAAIAQEIAETYGQEYLVDVDVGQQADDSVRFNETQMTQPGRKIANDYIHKLIEIYGRGCYEKFDAQAKAELDAARAEGSPERILAVEKRWPGSVWANESLFYYAEAGYLKARKDPNSGEVDLANACRQLDRVFRSVDSPLVASAGAALAVIYTRGQWRTSARNVIADLRKCDGEATVSFADIQGKLSDVLRQIESGQGDLTDRPLADVSIIRPPLVEKFAIKGEATNILFDQDYRPLRVDDRVAMISDGEAIMLNVARDRGEAEWKTPAGIDRAGAGRTPFGVDRYAYLPPGMRLMGALSRDRRILVVADRKIARGIDVNNGKIRWSAEYGGGEVGLGSFYCMGAGQGVLVLADTAGKVVCLDIANGKKFWENNLTGGQSRLPLGPPRIGGGLVVFRCDAGRTVTAMSLSRQGRVVGSWTGKQSSEAAVTEDGIILLMIDGELTARETERLDKPMWKVSYDANKNPGMIGVTGEMLAVASDSSGGCVDVLSIPGGGRRLSSLAPGPIEGSPGVAIEAAFDRGQVFLLCTAGLTMPRRVPYGQVTSARGLGLQKFNLADGKRLWSRDIENTATYYPGVLPMVVGRNHVLVSAKHNQAGQNCYVHVIESQTGQDVQKIDLRNAEAGAKDQFRRPAMGPPVMTNGRLVVETAEGVSVHGE